MAEHELRGGRLRRGRYDEAARRLELEHVDGSVIVYKGVPHEVWRRLCSAPNAASYVEDRIAEEYPNEPGSGPSHAQARARLDDLFAAPPSDKP